MVVQEAWSLTDSAKNTHVRAVSRGVWDASLLTTRNVDSGEHRLSPRGSQLTSVPKLYVYSYINIEDLFDYKYQDEWR